LSRRPDDRGLESTQQTCTCIWADENLDLIVEFTLDRMNMNGSGAGRIRMRLCMMTPVGLSED